MVTQKIIVDKTPELWLEGLRTGTDKFAFCKQQLFKTLKETGKTLTDIGSTPEEIDELENQNPRKVGVSYAKFWLNKVRAKPNADPRCQGQLSILMHKFNITMEEIGATPDEVS
jgi:hypothetical protein